MNRAGLNQQERRIVTVSSSSVADSMASIMVRMYFLLVRLVNVHDDRDALKSGKQRGKRTQIRAVQKWFVKEEKALEK